MCSPVDCTMRALFVSPPRMSVTRPGTRLWWQFPRVLSSQHDHRHFRHRMHPPPVGVGGWSTTQAVVCAGWLLQVRESQKLPRSGDAGGGATTYASTDEGRVITCMQANAARDEVENERSTREGAHDRKLLGLDIIPGYGNASMSAEGRRLWCGGSTERAETGDLERYGSGQTRASGWSR